MRNFDQVSPALQSSLTHYQIARLQGQALKICSEQLTGTILNEWLSNHPEMRRGTMIPKKSFNVHWMSLSDLLDQN
jgi:hypothetical protein